MQATTVRAERREEARIHHLQTVQFSDDDWGSLIADGEKRSRQKAAYRSTRLARSGTHELGMIGEGLFARLVGAPLNRALLVEGDGKVDFGADVDVKTTAHFDRPWLRVTPADLNAARVFALVAVDERTRRARYCGYATADMVRRTPLRKMHDAMPASHQLREDQLIRRLPRIA